MCELELRDDVRLEALRECVAFDFATVLEVVLFAFVRARRLYGQCSAIDCNALSVSKAECAVSARQQAFQIRAKRVGMMLPVLERVLSPYDAQRDSAKAFALREACPSCPATCREVEKSRWGGGMSSLGRSVKRTQPAGSGGCHRRVARSTQPG